MKIVLNNAKLAAMTTIDRAQRAAATTGSAAAHAYPEAGAVATDAAHPGAASKAVSRRRANQPSRRRTRWLAVGIPVALVAVTLAACGIGPVGTSPGEVVAALLDPLREPLGRLGVSVPELPAATVSLVWGVRLPRVALALLVGAGLAAAGAVMQAVFRNPLAEPGVTGVSSGAAVGAVAVIVSGAAVAAPWLLPLAAFVGALAAVAVVQLVAGMRGGAGATLLLVGIAVNAFLGAVIAAVIANAPDSDDAQQAMFWLNGDLTSTNWGDVGLAVAPIVVGTLLLATAVPELDLFALGDDHAASSGVRTGRARQSLLAIAALVTAAGVAVTGVISFVGLVVPHLVRLVLGPDHRTLLPVSMGFGAIFLVLADLIAPNHFDPVVLQTGTVTAFIGAPVLLVLVARRARAA
jgi:iron complex transport system permease protein